MDQLEQKSEKSVFSPDFEAFKEKFDKEGDLTAKLALTLSYMESSLAESAGVPHFLSFWEARRFAIQLFKENIPVGVKAELWQKCSELSAEARRLKELFDEMGSFAAEQIEIAIAALEREVVLVECIDMMDVESRFQQTPKAVEASLERYARVQRQLDKLNVHAARINALRKELLKNEVRVRQKNLFFKRLSSAGDLIFPKRRDLIKELSDQFTSDVEKFIDQHFKRRSNEMFYVLREEIKLFQSLAKDLTLSAEVFTESRRLLSECWDTCRAEEKERKKVRLQQLAVSKQNTELLSKEIDALGEKFKNGELDIHQTRKELEEIGFRMRKTELERGDFRFLKETCVALKNELDQKIESEEEERKLSQEVVVKQKLERFNALEKRISEVIETCQVSDMETLQELKELLHKEVQSASFSKQQKSELERQLKLLQDAVAEAREKKLLDLPADSRLALQQLRDALDTKKERRRELKNHIDVLRKMAGSSHLDFEKAMACHIELDQEKSRLEQLTESIDDIEEKIWNFENNIAES